MSESLPSANSSSFEHSAVVGAGFLGSEPDAGSLILTRARERAPLSKPGYAGEVTPPEAWDLVNAHAAGAGRCAYDGGTPVRGRIPDSIHVPWAIGPHMQRKPAIRPRA